ncbi:MAG: nucleoside transporter C-terminal domain-containing protein [Jaaginema sp. PMC 1079.18]|nr:nucleoside transporter C-terminal domain-containing protein [Jaaginema sp. PMC 1080.18]MEC4852716.1 nucleoside transporter C-terminal domain-containing protein [Jaaginema sp. PMC 1079.18]MEC4867029.1 nucleoside transporter C-terminal domain-containing protein [Jaaginema sp. PMC 1078.18]
MNPILNVISLLGIFILCAIAWLGSENRRNIPWRTIAWGIGLQLLLGLIVFVVGSQVVAWINDLLNVVLEASEAGARFLFGSSFVPDPNATVGPGPATRWIVRTVGDPYVAIPGDRVGPDNLNPGFILAFRSLPQVIFFSAIVALLYRLNIIQPIVKVFAVIFQKTLGISGAESLAGAANIFVGIESAIAVKPFLLKMTRSELCAILTSCFGSIASSVLGLYAGILKPTFPAITGHLVSASIMTIPACFVISKLLIPEDDTPETLGRIPAEPEDADTKKPNPMDSLILGALDGVKMAVGIAAVLIAILGLVALINILFSGISAWVIGASGGEATEDSLLIQFFSDPLNNLLGMLFLPLTFLTGVSLEWQELWTASVLIGQRLFQTSIPPYQALAQLRGADLLSDRSMLIVSYVLCGFAHLASYGIFVGGLSSLIPERRSEVSSLGFVALWGATLATLMTGCIAGVFDFGQAAVLGQ